MDTVIDASQMDPTFADQIAAEPGGEHIRRCFSCGTCTASCPVREVEVGRVASLNLMRGEK